MSAQVARLEGDLHARLLERTTRRDALTDEGRLHHARAVRILDELDALDDETALRARRVTGRLVAELPEFVGTRLVAPRLPRFLESHLSLSLRLVLNERIEEIGRADADVLVRFGLPDDGRLKYRRLGAMRVVCAASPAYLARRGAPARRGGARRARDDRLRRLGRGTRLRFDIVHDMDFVLRPLFAQCRLVPVLPRWRSPPYELYALWRPARPVPPRVAAFVTLLAEATCDAAAT